MTEWMRVRALYRGCGRGAIMRDLFSRDLFSVSGAVFVGFIVTALTSLVVAVGVAGGYWLAVALPVMVLVFGVLGGLVVEDRVHAVGHRGPGTDRDVAGSFRRGFLGVRYLRFREALRDAGCDTAPVLESALRCCDAERELRRVGLPRVHLAPVIVLTVLAAGIAAGAYWAPEIGVSSEPLRWLAAAVAFPALLLLALAVAQPVGRESLEELRCMLVWALEDVRQA